MLIILNNPVGLHQAGAVLNSEKVASKIVRKKYSIKMMQNTRLVQCSQGREWYRTGESSIASKKQHGMCLVEMKEIT